MRAMDFALTEQQELIRKEVSTLARAFAPDYWLEKDGKAEYPWEFIRAFAEGGWLGAIVPEEYGGSGLGVTEAALMLHDIAASGAGTSGCSPIHFYMFPPMPVIKHGSEDLKRRMLPRAATGEMVMSFGVTEPNAGTDTSRIETRADTAELMRTLGFSASPGLLRVFGVVPLLGGVIFAATTIWMLITMVVAVRQALDLRSTGRAVIICLIGWVLHVAIFFGLIRLLHWGST